MSDKKSSEKSEMSPKANGGILPLLAKMFGALAIVFATILFAGIYDLGHFGLRDMMLSLPVVPVAIFGLSAMAHLFLSGTKADPAQLEAEALTSMINDVQSKTTSRLAALQGQLDGIGGQDNESLLEENRMLKEQLEAIHQSERDKVLSEADELRARNKELELQIKQWAIQTVGGTVSDEKAA